MMVNNLTLFFPDDTFPALSAKFGAFLIWINDAARVAVRHQVVFYHLRDLMITAANEYVDTPSAKLLADHPESMGVRKIEKLIKPTSFSVANVGTPSPSNSKRAHTVNLNAPPDNTQYSGNMNRQGSDRRGTTRGGRDGYNCNFHPDTRSPNDGRVVKSGSSSTRSCVVTTPHPNELFVFMTPARTKASS